MNSDSVVFDVGGYKGAFAEKIYTQYNSTLYVFEPVKKFYEILNNKFRENAKIKLFCYGLAGNNRVSNIELSNDASSVYGTSKKTEVIKLKSIVDFISENNIKKIDLIKINIEGGEYELLESLLEHNLISLFNNIQVQFHDFIITDAKKRMKAIWKKLSLTHTLTYQYKFVWENWKLKEN